MVPTSCLVRRLELFLERVWLTTEFVGEVLLLDK